VWGGSDLDVGCAVLVAALGSEQSDAVDAFSTAHRRLKTFALSCPFLID